MSGNFILAKNSRIPLPASVASTVKFGDSFAAGVAASDSAHQWTTIVSAALSAGTPLDKAISGTVLSNANGSGGVPVTVNGATGESRYVADLFGANKRELLLFAYGFNDARYMGAPSTFNAAAYQASMDNVIGDCIVRGYPRERILIVSPYYITNTGLVTGTTNFTGQSRAGFEGFVAGAAAIADKYRTYYVDMYAYMRDNGGASLISGDNIHPTDTGHAAIAAGVLTATRYG